MGTFVSISGGGNANVSIHGNGSVAAGGGNDTIQITGNGNITVGTGHDVLSLGGSGYILQHGQNGSDTINLGSGNDSITEAGTATVHGAFGNATIEGGKFQFLDPKAGPQQGVYQEFAINGKATLVGGSHSTNFIAGSGSVVMQGGTGNDTFTGGSGHATMTGGSGNNLFTIGCHAGAGGTDIITNFVSGHDQLYLANDSYSWLQSHGDITVNQGNTYIKLDGGQTTVELKGFTGLTSSDVITHK
jgi:Ca2+-binding RTX toxin-like protein